MNVVDVAIGALCLGFALFGIVKGFVRQVSNWMGLVLGHVAGARYYPEAERFLRLRFRHGDVAAYVILFIAAYIGVRILGLVVERWVRGSKLSGTDRAAGMVAGLVNGALLSVLLVFVLVILLPRDASVLGESRLAPKAIVAARCLEKVFPEQIGRAFREKVPAAQEEAAREPAKETVGKAGKGTPAPLRSAPQPKNRSRK